MQITMTSTELQKQIGVFIRCTRLSLFPALVLALTLGLRCSLPAQAESPQAADPPVQTPAKAQTSTQSLGERAKSFVAHLPQRLASFAVGTAVGTPIALVRCTRRELARQTKEAYTLGGVPKPLGYVSAAVFGVPSGVLCGAWYGTADGVADSWVYSKDSLFSKDTFSLEKLVF